MTEAACHARSVLHYVCMPCRSPGAAAAAADSCRARGVGLLHPRVLRQDVPLVLPGHFGSPVADYAVRALASDGKSGYSDVPSSQVLATINHALEAGNTWFHALIQRDSILWTALGRRRDGHSGSITAENSPVWCVLQAYAFSTTAGLPYILVRGNDDIVTTCPQGDYFEPMPLPAKCVPCPAGQTSPGAQSAPCAVPARS